MSFEYLLDKLKTAPLTEDPFRHLLIDGFFSDSHFRELVTAPEIALPRMPDDDMLINRLQATGYKPIPFPGTTQDIKAYLRWRRGDAEHSNTDTCEGYGVTFRCEGYSTPLLEDLDAFFNSDAFLDIAAERFGIDRAATYRDNGLQKYLDGYEISPHPDIRKKALTYMINVNPSPDSEALNYHTHYLRFRPEYAYVEAFWQHHEDQDRCWVPWDWCESVSRQTRNNSIVMFRPAHDTLHAVRARYDHLVTQRTQFYGNLWYTRDPAREKPHWHDFVITASEEHYNHQTLGMRLKSAVPFKRQIKRVKEALTAPSA